MLITLLCFYRQAEEARTKLSELQNMLLVLQQTVNLLFYTNTCRYAISIHVHVHVYNVQYVHCMYTYTYNMYSLVKMHRYYMYMCMSVGRWCRSDERESTACYS